MKMTYHYNASVFICKSNPQPHLYWSLLETHKAQVSNMIDFPGSKRPLRTSLCASSNNIGPLEMTRVEPETDCHCNSSKHGKSDDLSYWNKANLRDLIAATGLVILLKLDSNHRFFSPCDLEIWRMTFKNNRAPLLCYFKLCASFQCHRLIQTGVTVR